MGGYAWVTLATNDSYSLGALVLAHSLKKSKTAHKTVVLITPAVSQPMREQLQTVFDVVRVVDVLDSKDEAHLALLQRPELGVTFTKIHCWKMVEFEKCVFLDADTLVVRNCDELFEREEFSAAPDVSWPDCFNSGVFVFRPSVQTFNELLQFAVEKGSFDGGDQGLLNQFFSSWATEDIKKHLPFVYNLTSVAAYSYIPAFKHYGSETRIVHFIGAGKPWLQQLDPATRTITPTSGSEHLAPLLQQWWDLFCEKVHPNLNKNLESNNDGMSHPPVAACSNSLPIALTDDSQTPRLIEPCTPYREKDDFRQYNLPYQPFDVKGSSGELLNVEFLLTSAARPTSPEVVLDEERREGDGTEEKAGQEETDERNRNEQNEERNDSGTEESDGRKEAESSDHITEIQQFRTEERISDWKDAETEEQNQQQESQPQSEEPEQPPPTVHPFDYDSFFPDETCINKYLEQNVITYQPYDSHSHHQPHENHQHDSSQNSISPQENNCQITIPDPQPQEDPAPSLPRFLTIPENDKRQSGNTDTQPERKQPDLQTTADPPQVEPPTDSPEMLQQQETVEEKRELTKSKSMPYLRYDVTEVPSSGCIWKSQPNVNVDPNRKYSMPKLKPILPRQNSLSRSVPSIAPKVTLYTEFLMSSEYKDPADLPKDKVGFVETLIHRKGQLRRTKSAADIGDKFGPLPYNSSPEIEQPAILKKSLSLHLESELYDLSQCKRQMGNKPKAKGADRRKDSSHSLPALKPLVPPKDKKSTLIKKRKSKELSPGDGGREKIFKKEAKMPKERKREFKPTPRNVSEAGTGNSVDEILTRLREFSKNYQHFFGVELQPGDKTADRKKAEGVVTPVTGAKQTPGERKSEREGPTFDSKFTHFRNYVKEKSRTSQKGLLSIQDLVSKPDDEGDAKASGEKLDDCERRSKVGDSVAGGVEEKDSAKGDSSVVRDELPESSRGDGKLCRTLANEDKTKDNSEGTVKSALHSTEEIETSRSIKNSNGSISSPAETCETKVTPANHSEEDIPEPESIPVVSGTGDAVMSCQERGEKSRSEEAEPELDVGKTAEEPEKLNLGEKKSRAAGAESKEDLQLTNEDRDLEKTTEKTHAIPTKLYKLKRSSLEQPSPSSCLDGTIPNGNGCPEVSETDFEPAEPVGLTLPEKAPEESASKSSPRGISGESNQLTTGTEAKSTAEVVENGETEADGVKSGEKLAGKVGRTEDKPAGKKERTEEKEKPRNTPEVLSDTPLSSRAPLPAPKHVAVGIVDEMLTKATLRQNQTSAPSRPTPRKPRKAKSSPKKPPRNRNSPPDETSPPVGGRTSPAAGKLTTPSPFIPQNGKALPESDEDTKVSSGIAGAIAQLSLEAGSDPSSESAVAASTAHQEYLRRQNWETGNMDYMGRDSFDNIWSKICKTLEEKEPEEAGPAAVSPKQSKQPSDPPATIPTKEATTPQPPPIAITPPTPSTTLQKCPEYIETLPGEPAAGPVEDDEIIFSKPDNRQSCLTNITEVEEDGKESSAVGAKPADAGKVKLSDILQPEAASTGPKEDAKTPVQTMTEKVGAPADEKKEVPQAVKPNKVEDKTAAKVQGASTPTEKAGASPDDKKEVPQAAKTQPDPNKVVDQTAAEVQPVHTATEKAAAPPDEKKEIPQAAKTQPEPSKVEDQIAAEVQKAKTPVHTATEKAAAPPDEKKEVPQAVKVQPEPNKVEYKTADKVEDKTADKVEDKTADKVEDKTAAKVQEASTPTEKAGAPPDDKKEIPQAVKTQPEPNKAVDQTAAEVQKTKTPAQTTTEKAAAPPDEKKEVPQAVKVQPEPGKVEDQSAAVGELPQVQPGAEKPETPATDDKSGTDKKPESCTTVAIPSPPIHFPGAPFPEKDKKAQSRRKPQEPAEEKFDPIPLPPPDTPPTEEPPAKTSDSAKDQGKQKKGVFTKILEMVGVAPKEKSEEEIPKSVFYDVKGPAPSKQDPEKDENAKEAEKQAPAAETETKEDVGGLKPDETRKVAPSTQSKDGEMSLSKPEETHPPETEAQKPQEGTKVKPPRSNGPKDPAQPSKNSIQVTQKTRSPSPKLTLPQQPPATAITTPTPPPHPDLPLTKTSGLLKVDDAIPETPPIPDLPKEATEESVKGKVLAEVEDIIGKAKTEVETRLQERRTPDSQTEDTSDLINAMKLMMATEGAQAPEVPVEELRVTTEEERMRHKGEVVSSKLSDQILKAIPPPRRKAISEGAGSSSGIPKGGSAPEKKAPESKGKAGKASSIPVPPPRSRGKPAGPTPPKGRGKK